MLENNTPFGKLGSVFVVVFDSRDYHGRKWFSYAVIDTMVVLLYDSNPSKEATKTVKLFSYTESKLTLLV